MSFLRLVACLMALLCFTDGALAQQHHFERYGVADGLAQAEVEALHQDRNGYLWIRTTNGFIRLDDGPVSARVTPPSRLHDRGRPQQWPRLEAVACTPDIDIALLDLQMPDRDGYDLARTLRDRAVPFPLIMLSSLGSPLPREAGHFDAWLTKPVKKDALFAVLGRVLSEAAPGPALERHTLAKADAEAAGRPGLRVLLAEDNVINQKVALRMLERLGIRADAVADGQEAVDAVRHTTWYGVFMDVQMPVMDGLIATRHIRREMPADLQPHIVAMTANAMKGDRERCLEAEMDDYITKPIHMEDLAAAL